MGDQCTVSASELLYQPGLRQGPYIFIQSTFASHLDPPQLCSPEQVEVHLFLEKSSSYRSESPRNLSSANTCQHAMPRPMYPGDGYERRAFQYVANPVLFFLLLDLLLLLALSSTVSGADPRSLWGVRLGEMLRVLKKVLDRNVAE